MTEQYLFFCRHGYRDDLNSNSYLFNPGLTSLGIAQSKLLAKELKKYTIQNMIVSPYVRTLETARHISESLDIPFAVDYGIAEWLNKSWMTEYPHLYTENEIKEHYPQAYFTTPLADIEYEYPESISQFKKRCHEVSKAIHQLKDSTVIITHGQVLSEICAILTQCTYDHFFNDICCLTILKKSKADYVWKVMQNGSIQHITKYLKFLNQV